MRHADLVKRVLAKRLQEPVVDNNTEIVKISEEAPKVQDEIVHDESNLLPEEKTLEKLDLPVSEEASKKKNNFSSKKKKTANSAT